MTRDRIVAKVYTALTTCGHKLPDNWPETLSLVADLSFDELDRVELAMELEEAFDIEVTDAEAEAWSTVGSVIDLVAAKVT
jgi:NADH dehydrogenase (ubiquinone) 1 alpha/beta subcomplex 1, acyl-carrier protein